MTEKTAPLGNDDRDRAIALIMSVADMLDTIRKDQRDAYEKEVSEIVNSQVERLQKKFNPDDEVVLQYVTARIIHHMIEDTYMSLPLEEIIAASILGDFLSSLSSVEEDDDCDDEFEIEDDIQDIFADDFEDCFEDEDEDEGGQ